MRRPAERRLRRPGVRAVAGLVVAILVPVVLVGASIQLSKITLKTASVPAERSSWNRIGCPLKNLPPFASASSKLTCFQLQIVRLQLRFCGKGILVQEHTRAGAPHEQGVDATIPRGQTQPTLCRSLGT